MSSIKMASKSASLILINGGLQNHLQGMLQQLPTKVKRINDKRLIVEDKEYTAQQFG